MNIDEDTPESYNTQKRVYSVLNNVYCKVSNSDVLYEFASRKKCLYKSQEVAYEAQFLQRREKCSRCNDLLQAGRLGV